MTRPFTKCLCLTTKRPDQITNLPRLFLRKNFRFTTFGISAVLSLLYFSIKPLPLANATITHSTRVPPRTYYQQLKPYVVQQLQWNIANRVSGTWNQIERRRTHGYCLPPVLLQTTRYQYALVPAVNSMGRGWNFRSRVCSLSEIWHQARRLVSQEPASVHCVLTYFGVIIFPVAKLRTYLRSATLSSLFEHLNSGTRAKKTT